MDIRIVGFEGIWTVLADEEALFATPSRHASVDRAMALAKALWDERQVETAVYVEDARGRELQVAMFGKGSGLKLAS